MYLGQTIGSHWSTFVAGGIVEILETRRDTCEGRRCPRVDGGRHRAAEEGAVIGVLEELVVTSSGNVDDEHAQCLQRMNSHQKHEQNRNKKQKITYSINIIQRLILNVAHTQDSIVAKAV